MQRSKAIDIIKGIGIILVVLGHCDNIPFLHRTIYLFHLTIFFIVSGYLYNEKCADEPWNYIGKLLKKYIKYYLIYNMIFVIGRNLFVYMGILDNAYNYYGYQLTLTGILNSFLFISVEPFSAPMWFIPVLFLGLVLLNFITYYSKRQIRVKQKEYTRLAIIVILTLAGIYLNARNINIGLHYQTTFAVLPFIYLGQCMKLYGKNYIKPNLKLSILIMGITTVLIYKIPGQVELSENSLWNPILYYILSPLMVYVVYTISIYIERYATKIAEILAYIGKNSLVIMCLHITFFKLFDYIYIHLITHEYHMIGTPICAYKNMWIIYVIVGVIGPLAMDYIVKNLISKCRCNYEKGQN